MPINHEEIKIDDSQRNNSFSEDTVQEEEGKKEEEEEREEKSIQSCRPGEFSGQVWFHS